MIADISILPISVSNMIFDPVPGQVINDSIDDTFDTRMTSISIENSCQSIREIMFPNGTRDEEIGFFEFPAGSLPVIDMIDDIIEIVGCQT